MFDNITVQVLGKAVYQTQNFYNNLANYHIDEYGFVFLRNDSGDVLLTNFFGNMPSIGFYSQKDDYRALMENGRCVRIDKWDAEENGWNMVLTFPRT